MRIARRGYAPPAPVRPDLVFPSRRKKVRIPATNRDYWLAKLERNHARDARNIALLEEQGRTVATVWECQLRDLPAAVEQITAFLGQPGPGRQPCRQ